MAATTCREPLLSNNGLECDALGLTATDDAFCFYRDDGECEPGATATISSACAARPAAGVTRFCACRGLGAAFTAADGSCRDDLSWGNLSDGSTVDGGIGSGETGVEQRVNANAAAAVRGSPPIAAGALALLALAVAGASASPSPPVSLGPVASLPGLILIVLAQLAPTVSAHNWINNPTSRTVGLSKLAPCPAKPNASSISFVAQQGVPFGVEWSTGHPNTFTYFIVVAAEDESKLGLATDSVINDYISSAPASSSSSGGSFLSDKLYDKTHVRWKPASGAPQGDRSGGALPTPGTGDGEWYQKRLVSGDATYFSRPGDWRCSRLKGFRTAAECAAKNTEIAQYEYIPAGVQHDRRVSYASVKYPWLLFAAKYKHVYKRPQDYDVAQLMLPADRFAAGSYVMQFQWRGYYDCFDIVLAPGSSGGDGGSGTSPPPPPPVVVKEQQWVKTEHCAYPSGSFEFKNNKKYKCAVVPANGDVSQCITNCNALNGCNAINIVPVTNPPLVRFQDDVNVPYTKKACKMSTIASAAAKVGSGALVCYGFAAPDTPDVGEAFAVSDDPRDAVFYSTCYSKVEVTRVVSSNAGDDDARGDPDPPAPLPAKWRFGDQCVACEDAWANSASALPLMRAPTWTIAEECRRCHASAAAVHGVECTDADYCNGKGMALVPVGANRSNACYCRCVTGWSGLRCSDRADGR
jgi:hypothetical protein